MAETVGRVHKLLSFLLQNTRGISVHPSEKFAILQLLLFEEKYMFIHICVIFYGRLSIRHWRSPVEIIYVLISLIVKY